MKKILCSLIVFILLSCSLCSCAGDPLETIREEFAKFDALNRVAIVEDNELITKSLRIDLEEVFGVSDSDLIKGVSIANDAVYAVIDNTSDSGEISIYKADINTKAMSLMKRIASSAGDVRVLAQDDWLFIDLISDNSVRTDLYSVVDGEYSEDVSEQELFGLRENRYSCIIDSEDSFVVTDSVSGESRVIDSVYLESTWYGGAMSTLSAKPYISKMHNGKIILVYRSDHWTQRFFGDHGLICFVYDFEKNEIVFDSILSADDEDVELIYNTRSEKTNYNYEYHRLQKNKSPQVAGAINFYLFYRVEGDTVAPAIKIYDSYRYRNPDEQRKIIETIIEFDGGEHGFSLENIDFYLLEWKFHNFAYDHPNSVSAFTDMPYEKVVRSSKDVDLNTNDPRREIYEQWEAAVWQ